AEDRRVRADGERDRDDRDSSKPRAIAQSAQRVTDVVLERAHYLLHFFAADSISAASSMNTFAYAALSSCAIAKWPPPFKPRSGKYTALAFAPAWFQTDAAQSIPALLDV